MDLVCRVCDRDVIEDKSEYIKYMSTLHTIYDKNIYIAKTINNINLDETDKILDDFVTTYNKKFDFYFLRCNFKLQFDNDFTGYIDTNYFHNVYITNLKRYLSNFFQYSKSIGYTFTDINQKIINSISDRWNMTYEYYINKPMHMCERKINLKVAKISTFDKFNRSE